MLLSSNWYNSPVRQMHEVFDVLLNVKDHLFLVFHSKDVRAVCCASQTVLMHTEGQASMGLFILFSLWYVFPPRTSGCIT